MAFAPFDRRPSVSRRLPVKWAQNTAPLQEPRARAPGTEHVRGVAQSECLLVQVGAVVMHPRRSHRAPAVRPRGRSKQGVLLLLLAAVTLLPAATAAGRAEPLPGTKPLTLDKPLDVVMVEGIQRFCLRELAASRDRR